MKKKYLMLGVAAILVSLAIAGGSLATRNAVGTEATNLLEAPTLGVSIDNIASAETRVDTHGENVMPGDRLDCSGFVVANTAEVPLYARVTVTKYWLDENDVKNPDLDADLIEMTADESGWLQANEVLVGTSGGTEVYYLARPLDAGETANLNLDIIISNELDNGGNNAGIEIKAEVDAVQYVEGENELNANGILSRFGVDAALNGDGTIASVTQ